MLTRATKIQLVVFAVIAVLVMGYTGYHYANLGRLLGCAATTRSSWSWPNAGGLFPAADVTYRGVSVGRVGAVGLTSTGVEADLNIDNSAPPIPAELSASVADLSAVGEQYVNLRPATSSGPYLAQGSVIPRSATSLPLPVTSLLTSVNQLATSVPLGELRTVLDNLATGFGGTSTSLQELIDGQNKLVRAAGAALPQTDTLIQDGQTVLATQNEEADAFRSFAASSRLFAGQLVASDADLRRLFTNGAAAAAQVAGLITDNDPDAGRADREPADHLADHPDPRGRAAGGVLGAARRDRRRVDGDHQQGGALRRRADVLQPAAVHRRVPGHEDPQRAGYLTGATAEHQRAMHLAAQQRDRRARLGERAGARVLGRAGQPARPEPMSPAQPLPAIT